MPLEFVEQGMTFQTHALEGFCLGKSSVPMCACLGPGFPRQPRFLPAIPVNSPLLVLLTGYFMILRHYISFF